MKKQKGSIIAFCSGLFHKRELSLIATSSAALVVSFVVVGSFGVLSSCGQFQKKTEKKTEQPQPVNSRSEVQPGNEDSNAIPLTSPTSAPVAEPTAVPSLAPDATPSAPPAVIKFSEIKVTLDNTCGICHSGTQILHLKTFAEYKQNKEKIVNVLETKQMPPFLSSGEDPSLWTSTPEGSKVLQYFKQQGELEE